jgi:anti-anti-sigma factor
VHDRPNDARPAEGACAVSVETRHPHSGLTLVRVRGRVGDAADLARWLADAVTPAADGAAPQVVLDLAGATSLSAAGLGVILRAQASLEAGGGGLELLDPSPAVVLLLHDAVLAEEDVPAGADDHAKPNSRIGVSRRIRARSDASGTSSTTRASNGP